MTNAHVSQSQVQPILVAHNVSHSSPLCLAEVVHAQEPGPKVLLR
jgi:hypothetical protein